MQFIKYQNLQNLPPLPALPGGMKVLDPTTIAWHWRLSVAALVLIAPAWAFLHITTYAPAEFAGGPYLRWSKTHFSWLFSTHTLSYWAVATGAAFLATGLLACVLHEFVHAWASPRLGAQALIVMVRNFYPACSWVGSIPRRAYFTHLLAPFVLLGVVPVALALMFGGVLGTWLAWVGASGLVGASGDICTAIWVCSHAAQATRFFSGKQGLGAVW
jgi:hypothetical protein